MPGAMLPTTVFHAQDLRCAGSDGIEGIFPFHAAFHCQSRCGGQVLDGDDRVSVQSASLTPAFCITDGPEMVRFCISGLQRSHRIGPAMTLAFSSARMSAIRCPSVPWIMT